MVYRCVVRGCKKVAVPGVRSVHKIPSKRPLRNEWKRFVNKTRPGWTGSESSRICSEHFTPDNYGNFLAWQMGKARKLDLKPSAVPTVYPGEAGPSGEQSSSLVSVDAIIREYDEDEANRDTVYTPESVQDSELSSSEWERSDDDIESEKKDDCCLAALVLSPVSTHKRRFRVKRVPLDHHAVPCGSSRCHVLQSDCSNNKMENKDGKGELKVKDEPVEECVFADSKEREKEFSELGNIESEDHHHSLQGWVNSSDQDEFEVKDEPVEEDYVCVLDTNGTKINEEEISSSLQNTSAFLIQLQHSIREANYKPDQVFVVSKTGLFSKRLPGQTFISKKEELSSGLKARNDRFSLLLCANASGDSRLKPFLVYHTCKLKDLKVTSFQMLPVHWRYNRRASLTAILFEDWFTNCAISEILAYCKQKNIEEKALILVDSVLGQSDIVNEIHPYIKVIFMPSDMPPDQFAITQFLQLYTKTLLQNMLIFTEGGDESQVEDFLTSYSIKEALFTIRDSWTAIKTPFLNKFWSYAWPGKTQSFTGHLNATEEIQEIRDLANEFQVKVL
ncbi:tigger transposable element-derived protein 1-like isoform X4 [Penaeus monodon]|uniref:tigger transposable element-derived protein 1-like isoform X4 n=1 Tax=Penaeus monodon TaxID=6687 RepID=UPI0018A7DBFE|nr:tigger transposable element-derived protein 1-like isoform X4 [Penaeus monodon]